MAEQPEEGTRLTAAQIHENVLRPAEQEIRRPAAALLLSALAAGLVIGFSCLAAAFMASAVPEPYKHAAAAAAYPLGFIFVIMARSELFTENTLVPVIPLLERRDLATLRLVARIWVLLLVGNLIGTVLFGVALAHTGLLRPAYAAELLRISREATEGGFGEIVYAAVFAGWLMALLAWLLASTTSTLAQIIFIWLCTAPISALHFPPLDRRLHRGLLPRRSRRCHVGRHALGVRGSLGPRKRGGRRAAGGVAQLRAGARRPRGLKPVTGLTAPGVGRGLPSEIRRPVYRAHAPTRRVLFPRPKS
jgi:formate/nitrite transporter FocA (FNT family)